MTFGIARCTQTAYTITMPTLTRMHTVDSTELMSEAKAGLKARVEAELAAAADDDELKTLRDRFSAEERSLEHSIDHEVHSFSAALTIDYNFLSK